MSHEGGMFRSPNSCSFSSVSFCSKLWITLIWLMNRKKQRTGKTPLVTRHAVTVTRWFNPSQSEMSSTKMLERSLLKPNLVPKYSSPKYFRFVFILFYFFVKAERKALAVSRPCRGLSPSTRAQICSSKSRTLDLPHSPNGWVDGQMLDPDWNRVQSQHTRQLAPNKARPDMIKLVTEIQKEQQWTKIGHPVHATGCVCCCQQQQEQPWPATMPKTHPRLLIPW